METVIAYKQKNLWIVFLLIALAGAMCVVMGKMRENLFYVIGGVLLVILSFVSAIRYFLLPSQMIVLSCDGRTLILPKGATVPVGSIMKVLYYQGKQKQCKTKWGRVTIYTYSDTYHCDFVANCEDVEKELTQLIHKAKKKRYKIKGERKL